MNTNTYDHGTNKKHSWVRRHGHGRAIIFVILSLFVGAILMMWGWNTVAAGLLGAPEVRFVHSLAVQAGIFGALAPVIAILRVNRTEQRESVAHS